MQYTLCAKLLFTCSLSKKKKSSIFFSLFHFFNKIVCGTLTLPKGANDPQCIQNCMAHRASVSMPSFAPSA